MAKKVINFRISEEDDNKLTLLEYLFKKKYNTENWSRTLTFHEIINIAYKTVTEGGTSSINQDELIKDIKAIVENTVNEHTEKVDSIFNAVKEQIEDSKDLEKNDDESLSHLLLLIEEVELILKLLPYGQNYKTEIGSEKTEEISNLVQSRSMFRKYAQKKVKNILDMKANKNGNFK